MKKKNKFYKKEFHFYEKFIKYMKSRKNLQL